MSELNVVTPAKWLRRALMGALALILLVGVLLFLFLPAVLASACPSCFGLQSAGGRIFLQTGMSAEKQARFLDAIQQSRANIAGFYGNMQSDPVFLVCATPECDFKLGGKGAKAIAIGTDLIRVGPDGMDAVVLTHELSHIELHTRIGMSALLQGKVAAWFDEGLAVVVSQDPRYLQRAPDGQLSCRAKAIGTLPVKASDWRRQAGQDKRAVDQGQYAQAACAVLHWMQDHGGNTGLLAAIAATRQSGQTLPATQETGS